MTTAPARVVAGAGCRGLVCIDPGVADVVGFALLVGETAGGSTSGLPDGFRPTRVERASLSPGGDWWAGDLRRLDGRLRYRAFHHGAFRAEVAHDDQGDDLVLPSLAALAVGVRLGLAAGVVGDRLAECPAVPRRFEARGSYCGATLVEDDTLGVRGVSGALTSARNAFGRRPIRAVFLAYEGESGCPPGSPAPPTVADFAQADHTILVARDASRPESARLLAAGLRSSGASVVLCASLSGAIRELDRTLGPGDVVMMLGSDAVGMIADALLRRLARDRRG